MKADNPQWAYICFYGHIDKYNVWTSYPGGVVAWSYGSWIYNHLYNLCLSPLILLVQISIRVRCSTLSDKVCQWLATCPGFSPVSPTNKTYRQLKYCWKWRYTPSSKQQTRHTLKLSNVLCSFILYPYQAIDRLSKGSLSTDVESMRTKSFDKCIKNEMEEDIRNEMKEIREEFMELQHQVTDNTQEIHNINTRHCIPSNIQSKLIVVFSV